MFDSGEPNWNWSRCNFSSLFTLLHLELTRKFSSQYVSSWASRKALESHWKCRNACDWWCITLFQRNFDQEKCAQEKYFVAARGMPNQESFTWECVTHYLQGLTSSKGRSIALHVLALWFRVARMPETFVHIQSMQTDRRTNGQRAEDAPAVVTSTPLSHYGP